jgi:hypothetical protein
MDILAALLFLTLVAMFLIRACMKGARQAIPRDHWALITSFAVAVTTFVIAPLLMNWVIVPTAI